MTIIIERAEDGLWEISQIFAHVGADAMPTAIGYRVLRTAPTHDMAHAQASLMRVRESIPVVCGDCAADEGEDDTHE